MYTLRRWWDRHGLQMALAVMAIGAAVAVQQSQGSIIFEVFQTVTRPFDLSPNLEEQRQKARMLAGEERLVELKAKRTAQKATGLRFYQIRSRRCRTRCRALC
jgi:rod shape-determining protein MreC